MASRSTERGVRRPRISARGHVGHSAVAQLAIAAARRSDAEIAAQGTRSLRIRAEFVELGRALDIDELARLTRVARLTQLSLDT